MKIIRTIRNKNKGFSIIEMLMVLAIFVVISSIVIFNYSDFKSSVSLENLSQDIATNIRIAQSYSTSVKGSSVVGSSTLVFPGYGMHFSNTSNSTADKLQGSDKSFIFFADIIGGVIPTSYDPMYENGTKLCGYATLEAYNECIEEYRINSNDSIVEICDDSTPSSPICINGSLDISFMRPQPDAIFCFRSGNNGACTNTHASSVYIKLVSDTGKFKLVRVWNTGQISIE